jgi:cyclic dehypoxanthinyl futalosine synthase
MKNTQQILDRVLAGKRLSTEDALWLWQKGEWTDMVKAAHQIRQNLHGSDEVTYTAFRLVNYTNYCNVECTFCSFMDDVGSGKGYNLTLKQMEEKALEAKKYDADHIFLQGGVNPELPLEYYTEALELFKSMDLHVRGFSPVELLRLAEKEEMEVSELLEILKAAGLGSVPGAGAEILTENMRDQLSPKKLSAEDWCFVMGECHKAGLQGSCNIVFGSTETDEDVIMHLNYIREQQDKTGGFLSFVPWVFQQQTKDFTVNYVKGTQYLKMIALSRLFFDNIDHIEVSVLGMGKELGELALSAGADDINSIVIEENVLASKGLKTLRAAQKFIEKAGFKPKRRTLCYEYDKYL